VHVRVVKGIKLGKGNPVEIRIAYLILGDMQVPVGMMGIEIFLDKCISEIWNKFRE